MAGAKLLRAFAAAYPAAFFVEIGANDGHGHDHLRSLILDSHWRGVMVEPVPYVFDLLARNYAHLSRISLENSAIADRNGHMPFYHFAEIDDPVSQGLPEWYHALGSFQRETILWHASWVNDVERYVIQTDVPTITFDVLCRKHRVDQLDLLVIDAEGYDDEILRTINFERYRPRMVIYEHFHLIAQRRAAARTRLEQHGYNTMEEGGDTWCLLPRNASDSLTRVWRDLTPQLPALSFETSES